MPRESLGFIRMVWVCPNCQNKNPGNFRFCRGCGAPQPADVKFVPDDRPALITDAKEIEQAKLGADVHCGFCGARNPADAKVCSACGADLATGLKHESGTVVGAYQSAPAAEAPCPHCGTLNPTTALACKGCGASLGVSTPAQPAPAAAAPARKLPVWIPIAVVGAVLACVVLAIMLATRTSDVSASVARTSWERSIAILALQPVDRRDWKNKIPTDAQVGACEQRLYGESDQPAENSKKVCGTPYSVDKGNGYAEVVQDCKYEVYADYCTYTVQDWTAVDQAVARGSDNNPVWPQLSLAQGQKTGDQNETYTIVFSTADGEKTYQTTNVDEFAAAQPGTHWLLKVNSFGAIAGIEPGK